MAIQKKAQRLFRCVVAAVEAAIHEYRSHQSRDDLPYSRSALLYSNSRYEQQSINWGVRIVPENMTYVVERLGKYHRILDSGIHILLPFVDQIADVHSLKDECILIPYQSAFTKDKIVDLFLASYGVARNPIFMVIQLTETTMKDELRKITLNQIFEENDALNENITRAINEVASNWGLKCLSLKIRKLKDLFVIYISAAFSFYCKYVFAGDIFLPPEVLKMQAADMMMQAKAERRKRARVLESEGTSGLCAAYQYHTSSSLRWTISKHWWIIRVRKDDWWNARLILCQSTSAEPSHYADDAESPIQSSALSQQLHNLLGSNAQLSNTLQNPELIQHLTSPKTLQRLLSFQQTLLSSSGQRQTDQALAFSFREQNQTGAPATGAINTSRLEFLMISGLGSETRVPNSDVPPEE
ncbi:hypothetical protein ZIOFF_046454 [Zingiber officinale]|uniref:Band 7 domain-containing protein n=1 Tax=Zingiber officinale TaxID=94328 RepID=A0A8J5KNQ7_ZINOF|nr:hypothetical protein ZIOFF_046454 [Zingiber officinale]